jgi:hypothetical protein
MRTVILDEFDYVGDKIYVSYTINDNQEVKVSYVKTGGKENIDISYIESVLQEKLHNVWE